MDLVAICVTYLHAIITQSIIIILNKVLFLRSIQNTKIKYFTFFYSFYDILPLFYADPVFESYNFPSPWRTSSNTSCKADLLATEAQFAFVLKGLFPSLTIEG